VPSCWPAGRWAGARTPRPACCARPASRSCCSCWGWASWSRRWCATAWARAVAGVTPGGSGLLALLALAGLAAALANLVNNLPAVLVLLSVLRGSGQLARPGPVLAVLIGVDVGPNLSYAGSLATLLWRRLLADRDHHPDLAEFTRLGLLTVPAGIVLATLALWAGLHV
jgi:arsenical pump membrane protein